MSHGLFPTLLCDVGGTNIRFALDHDGEAPITPLPPARTRDFQTFEAAARLALAAAGTRARSCVVCAAGPVVGVTVRLTNANWTIDGPTVARDLGLDNGLLLNDFEALALTMPVLEPAWLRPIGRIQATGGPRVIHGPGTGLGTAALIEADGKWRAIASEGSHCDFAPVYPEDWSIWPHIEKRDGRITPESLISGPGLRRLHRARIAALGRPRPELSEAEIISRAVESPASEEAETARLFWRLAARYAGDIALNFLATGGVVLAGGMLPRIAQLLDDSQFRATFENKAPYEELARGIPVHLLLKSDAVLHGMAAIARRPELYAIDRAARAWR